MILRAALRVTLIVTLIATHRQDLLPARRRHLKVGAIPTAVLQGRDQRHESRGRGSMVDDDAFGLEGHVVAGMLRHIFRNILTPGQRMS